MRATKISSTISDIASLFPADIQHYCGDDGLLLRGDCLELMKELPDGCIDMVLCDLPYGMTACVWDIIIPFNSLWEQYKRVTKDNVAIVLTASQPFTSKLIMSNLEMFRYEWIWIKNRGSNFALAKRMPMKEHENICVFYKKQPIYRPVEQQRQGDGGSRVKYIINPSTGSEIYGGLSERESTFRSQLRCPSSWQKFNTEVGLHSTQKPVDLFKYLLKTYTNDDALVLDNCIGSGTTAVAAKELGRCFIGMEIEPKYCEIAAKRLVETGITTKDNRVFAGAPLTFEDLF